MNSLSRFTTKLLLFLFIATLPTFLPGIGNIRGQTAKEEQQRQDEAAREAARRREQQRRSLEALKADRERLTNFPAGAKNLKARPGVAEEEKKLAPTVEDRQAYAAFLRQEGTGLFRILPAERYEATNVVSASATREGRLLIAIEGGGGYYSFTKKTHEKGKWSEITLDDDQFRVGMNGVELAMMSALGDVQLEAITLETAGVAYPASFKPPADLKAAAEQHERIAAGIKSAGHIYRANLPAILNNTYVLRSCSYERSDILVVFRVVRSDENGGLTILWKRLKKYPTPVITRSAKGVRRA